MSPGVRKERELEVEKGLQQEAELKEDKALIKEEKLEKRSWRKMDLQPTTKGVREARKIRRRGTERLKMSFRRTMTRKLTDVIHFIKHSSCTLY